MIVLHNLQKNFKILFPREVFFFWRVGGQGVRERIPNLKALFFLDRHHPPPSKRRFNQKGGAGMLLAEGEW